MVGDNFKKIVCLRPSNGTRSFPIWSHHCFVWWIISSSSTTTTTAAVEPQGIWEGSWQNYWWTKMGWRSEIPKASYWKMHKKVVSKNKIGFLSTLWLIDLRVDLISVVTLLLHGVGVVHADHDTCHGQHEHSVIVYEHVIVYVGKSEHNNQFL